MTQHPFEINHPTYNAAYYHIIHIFIFSFISTLTDSFIPYGYFHSPSSLPGSLPPGPGEVGSQMTYYVYTAISCRIVQGGSLRVHTKSFTVPSSMTMASRKTVGLACAVVVVWMSVVLSEGTSRHEVAADASVVKPAPQREFRVVIEGWKNVPHSYAMVATQLAAGLLPLLPPHARIFFTDIPLWNPKWPRSLDNLNSRILHEAVSAIPNMTESEWRNVTIRCAFPYDVRPRKDGSRVFTIATAEFLSVDDDIYWAGGLDTIRPLSDTVTIITHSSWSAAGFINTGIPPRKVKILSLGVDNNVFFPLTVSEKRFVRSKLNLPSGPNTTVFFNVGAMTHNKGIDLLLPEFKHILDDYPGCCILILKGLDGMYSSIDRLRYWVNEYGLPKGTVRYDGAVLSSEQLNYMYNAADAYIAPYRAEAFNMPVLEAMSVGLPVIVTSGGSTDDFVVDDNDKATLFIKSQLVHAAKNISLIHQAGRMLKPDRKSLYSSMVRFLRERGSIQKVSRTLNVRAALKHSWEHFAKQTKLLLGLEEYTKY